MVEEEERPKYSRNPGEHTSNASRKRQGKRQRRGMPQGRQENENTCNGRDMPRQNHVNKCINRGRGRGIGMPQEIMRMKALVVDNLQDLLNGQKW
ncbi:hypothetical protein RDI58_013352 [Solanum bulbocastanum]|uniref:Uncharacterized protein n=1 Tax=Solanum bulbocastanum TaxID=147425 RepID=A0AAN8YEK0_SOLBU